MGIVASLHSCNQSQLESFRDEACAQFNFESSVSEDGMEEDVSRMLEGGQLSGAAKEALSELFHVEPSRRGQRRANLFKQRMNEATEEEAMRKGKGSQAFWEAARVGNMDEIMNKLFRCVHDQHGLKTNAYS